MSKRIDFAKKRRDQGRLLNSAVRELLALVEPVAHQNGIDLQGRLTEASARKSEEGQLLAQRLQESVAPLFIIHDGKPDRIGTCVLVRLDSDFFAFTAAHVIRRAGSAHFFVPSEGRGGKLLPLPSYTVHLSSQERDNDLDVGVLALKESQLGRFQRRAFLAGTQIDKNDRPDDQTLASFYLVLGYSASRTQVRISRTERRIHQQSFRCSTHPVCAAEYAHERMSQADHILLDFDHKEIKVEGRRVDPPRLQVSAAEDYFISPEKQCKAHSSRSQRKIDAAHG
jgi:hypothetical protein